MDRSHCINWVTATSDHTVTAFCVNPFKLLFVLFFVFIQHQIVKKRTAETGGCRTCNTGQQELLQSAFLSASETCYSLSHRGAAVKETLILAVEQWDASSHSACGWWPGPNKSHGWSRWIRWRFKFFNLCSCFYVSPLTARRMTSTLYFFAY